MAANKLNAAYWRKRALQQVQKQAAADNELNLKLKAEYDRILHELDKELAVFYARYADNEGISLAKARKLLRDAELEDFRMSLDEFREKAILGGYDKELNEIYLRSRVSRLQALETQIELRMQDLFGSQRDLLHDHLAGAFLDTYYQSIYAISQQTSVLASFARIDFISLESILARPWLDDNFSSRIWADRDKLTRELETTLAQAFVRGEPLDRTAKMLAERMGVSQRRAATLVNTESAHIAAEATMRGYQQTGVEQYRFEAGLDLKTCPLCGAMDGKVFALPERITGANYPPLHPNCRCTTVPVTEFELDTPRAARDPVTGKTMYVDKGLTYDEWHKKYVEGVPEAAAAEKAYRNRYADKKQYARYREQLGSKNVPRTFAEFQKIKYNESKGWTDLQRAYKDQPIRDKIRSGEQPKTIEAGKQGKHILGHNNYIDGRSYLTVTMDEAQKLVDQYAGIGELRRDQAGQWTHKEFIKLENPIGVWVDPKTGAQVKTNRFAIHYSKKGVHIVPTRE